MKHFIKEAISFVFVMILGVYLLWSVWVGWYMP